jgi:hypothetical protein
VWEERSDDDASMTDEEDTDTRARVSQALEVLFCQSRMRLHG